MTTRASTQKKGKKVAEWISRTVRIGQNVMELRQHDAKSTAFYRWLAWGKNAKAIKRGESAHFHLLSVIKTLKFHRTVNVAMTSMLLFFWGAHSVLTYTMVYPNNHCKSLDWLKGKKNRNAPYLMVKPKFPEDLNKTNLMSKSHKICHGDLQSFTRGPLRCRSANGGCSRRV